MLHYTLTGSRASWCVSQDFALQFARDNHDNMYAGEHLIALRGFADEFVMPILNQTVTPDAGWHGKLKACMIGSSRYAFDEETHTVVLRRAPGVYGSR